MIKELDYKYKLRLMLLGSFALSFLLLNRWIVTDLQEKSFGRVWQYYVSWGDFGFFRRGLLGTVLTETGMNQIVRNEYIFAYSFYFLILIAVYFIVYQFLKKLETHQSKNLISFVVLFSPAVFSHFSYSTGNNDLLLFLIFLCAVFFRTNVIFFTGLLVIGIFVHELFIFMLPAAIWFRYVLTDDLENTNFKELIFSTVVCIMAIGLLYAYGTPTIAESEFLAIMEKRMPNAAYQHSLWSGYREVALSYEPYLFGESTLQMFRHNFWKILIPTLYALSLATFCAMNMNGSIAKRQILFAALLAPFAAQIVATDYYRWVSMSAAVSLMFLLLYALKHKAEISRSFLIFLMCFSILMPFGGAELARPFPMHQFLLEKISHYY